MNVAWNAASRTLMMAAVVALAIACGREQAQPQSGGPSMRVTNNPAEPAPPAPTAAPADAAAAPAATAATAATPAAPAPEAGQRNIAVDTAPAVAPVIVAPVAQPIPQMPAAAPQIPAPQGSDKVVGLRYAVLLEGDPTFTPNVVENVTFASGQRFQLLLIPTHNMYIYLIHEGSDGTFSVLPPPGVGTRIDRLTQGRTQVIPTVGWLRMDAQPGTERIHIVAGCDRNERVEQLLERGLGANDPAAVRQTLMGVLQREQIGFIRNQMIGSNYSEITMSGDNASRAFICGTIYLKHQ